MEKKILHFVIIALAGFTAWAKKPPRNFLFLSGPILENMYLVNRSDIKGVQMVYNWKSLETAEDIYDFSAIIRDLKILDSLHKKLFIQIQDRFFEPEARNVPSYLFSGKQYKGGLARQVDNPGENLPKVYGWVAMQWNPAVQLRYQKLLEALALEFDGKIYGVNLPETSIDIDRNDPSYGFSCDQYFEAEIANMKFARKLFAKSYVVQYVNFFPCEWNNDKHYMSRLFEAAAASGIGLGGPDIIPGRKAHMKNSYPFFHKYKDKLELVAMAVQEPTLTYENPLSNAPFTRMEFTSYAQDFLGADIIFWSGSAPWLL